MSTITTTDKRLIKSLSLKKIQMIQEIDSKIQIFEELKARFQETILSKSPKMQKTIREIDEKVKEFHLKKITIGQSIDGMIEIALGGSRN